MGVARTHTMTKQFPLFLLKRGETRETTPKTRDPILTPSFISFRAWEVQTMSLRASGKEWVAQTMSLRLHKDPYEDDSSQQTSYTARNQIHHIIT